MPTNLEDLIRQAGEVCPDVLSVGLSDAEISALAGLLEGKAIEVNSVTEALQTVIQSRVVQENPVVQATISTFWKVAIVIGMALSIFFCFQIMKFMKASDHAPTEVIKEAEKDKTLEDLLEEFRVP